MKFLVTGAAGFVGSKLAARLISQGHQVVTIDNLSTGSINVIPTGVEFIQGDCQDPRTIDRLAFHTFDSIFHIAGQSSGEISFEDPVYDLQTNTQSTLQLLQYCVESGCRRFIYASSMSVYGDQEQLPVRESASALPKSFYAIGKLASEHYLRLYANLGVGSISLRLFNVYGPGQNLDNLKQGMVSIFLAQALRDGRIHVKGSGDRFRDFVFIDDVIEAFILADQNCQPDKASILNVCSGIKTTVNEVVDTIVAGLSVQIPVTFEGGTPGDQFGIYGDYSSIEQQFGWTPSTNFESGMEKMIEWAKQRQ